MEKIKNFLKRTKKHLIFLCSFLLLTFLSMGIADGIQKSWGAVNVSMGSFTISEVNDDMVALGNYEPEETTNVVYKLYKPKSATPTEKAPAVLLLHGYQNDHETSAAYAIELSRRGVVVVAIDEYGHGKTDTGMRARGYVNRKVTVNYGTHLGEEKAYVDIGGQVRYRVLMNFSNLTCFADEYSTDSSGNSIKDSSMGGIAAYAFMSTLDYVDNTRMAVSGHSMGTWASWTVSAAFEGTSIETKATVLQCGELFKKEVYDHTKLNNILLLQAKWDEFSYFRDYKNVVDDNLIKDDLRLEFLGCTKEEAKWNTQYGNFADGSARKVQLLYTNHRLTTHDAKGMSVALAWFTDSIGITTSLKTTNQVFMLKETLVLVATLSSIASMFALMGILLKIPFFACVEGKVTDRPVKTGWKWWKGAVITILIAGATYPFMTQLGHGLLPLPDTTIFRMTIGNGFLSWYLLLIVIMLLTTLIPWFKKKKKGIEVDYVDLGLAREEHKDKFDWPLAGKGALVALCMFLFMYLQVVLCEAIFLLDFRFIWPFFKGFTWMRLYQFVVYLPIFIVFFVLNNSKIFAQMRNDGATKPGFKGFMSCWWRNALCMVGGILLLILIEYIPFFANIGPGADLLFSPTFGGPFMSLMIVFVPQVIVFSLFCTYAYRKTGNVYIGAYMAAILACWIVTGGSSML